EHVPACCVVTPSVRLKYDSLAILGEAEGPHPGGLGSHRVPEARSRVPAARDSGKTGLLWLASRPNSRPPGWLYGLPGGLRKARSPPLRQKLNLHDSPP